MHRYVDFNSLTACEAIECAFERDPTSVDPSWRLLFDSLAAGREPPPPAEGGWALKIERVVQAYRVYGHLAARCNPLEEPCAVAELDLARFGLRCEELDLLVPTLGFLPAESVPLAELLDALRRTYCGAVGVEYQGCVAPEIERWIQARIEPFFDVRCGCEEKRRIAYCLQRAEAFEAFLHARYVGQKRFSLEGEEALIPLLEALIAQGAEGEVREVVLGMSHRGRLNILTHLLNKPYAYVFREFEERDLPSEGSGDVKYHRGFRGTFAAPAGVEVDLLLCANPSHVESIDPVVVGIARARQERLGRQPRAVLPLLIHGDAAVAGQGVVYETLQMGRLNGYGTGGALHVVVNNQIGFTTLPEEGRSTRYCTDIAKAFGAPIFHVNAEEPESCVAVARMAIDLRQTFACDVFIDLNGYRKHGHSESDEPTFTQPLEYQKIRGRPPVYATYCARLLREGVLTKEEIAAWQSSFKEELQEAFGASSIPAMQRGLDVTPEKGPLQSGVSAARLSTLAERICDVPRGFALHPKMERLLQERRRMVQGPKELAKIDWGMAEALAYASLLVEGVHVRLSGQDCCRGTFSHRHAVWVDQRSEERYFPLSHLAEGQAPFDIFNSPLSEYGVLGFEFGYNLFDLDALILWEAQFGDFANGAQIVVDQYIATCEQKWGERSSLVLLLPHGYEGQGPEHSSARLERFLQLAADSNMRIAQCTTPAQFFHLLRQQVQCDVKRPLVIATPKRLLRHPAALSTLVDLAEGAFVELLEEPAEEEKAHRLLLCSGKVYYALAEERQKRGERGVALVRLEQLYPFPHTAFAALVDRYRATDAWLWVQEEPANMGAWSYVEAYVREAWGIALSYVGRERSASPAVGSHALHCQQEEALLSQAFTREVRCP